MANRKITFGTLDEQTAKTLDAIVAAYNKAIIENTADESAIEVWVSLIRERRLRSRYNSSREQAT